MTKQSPHEIVAAIKAHPQFPLSPPGPPSDAEMEIIDANERVDLDHVRDLGECPLGDASMAIAAFFQPGGKIYSYHARFNLTQRVKVVATVITPDFFNESVTATIKRGDPYIVTHTNSQPRGKWLHANVIPLLQNLLRGSSVGVAFGWQFNEEPHRFISYIADFEVHPSLTVNQTILSSSDRKPSRVDFGQLEKCFPPHLQPGSSVEEGQDGLRFLRRLRRLESYGQDVATQVWRPLPLTAHPLQSLSSRAIEEATVRALRRLLEQPLTLQEESIPITWDSQPALAVIKIKGDAVDPDFMPGEQTRIQWQEQDHSPVTYPTAASAGLALNYSFQSNFFPKWVSRNLLPRFRLMIWSSWVLEAITHGVFIHLSSGKVKLISLVSFHAKAPSDEAVRRTLDILSNELDFRFHIRRTAPQERPDAPIPIEPIDIIEF